MSEPIHLARVSATVYRCPLDTPVVTAFGKMHDRPMVVVTVEARDGTKGYGEVWCNFPAVGAEHRARLVDTVLAPLVTAYTYQTPNALFADVTARTEVLALQCAEPGPFAQAIAGLDIAVWDLAARMAGKPLWRYLEPTAQPTIGVYASGLNPQAPERLAASMAADGHVAFKLKVGFGRDRDIGNLRALRETLGSSSRLMVDANQAWDLATAQKTACELEPLSLDWLEEPLRADRPWSEWQALSDTTSIPLAAGENVAGAAAFERALGQGSLRVVQPDVAKWGGISMVLPLAREIRRRGKRYCPHHLGGGIGLLTSAHVLAAAGGDGSLEIDANPNPLRTLLCGALSEIVDGRATLTSDIGLGVAPDIRGLAEFKVEH